MVKNYMVAIEELLAIEVIRRGKILNGTDSSATRIIIEKMCINVCGGRWEFGTYFFLENEINVYLNFDDVNTQEKIAEKFTFSKGQVEDFVFKYIGNENISIDKPLEKKVINPVKKTKKKEILAVEQMSLF